MAAEPELVAVPDDATATVLVAFHLAADAVDAVDRLIAGIPAAGGARASLATGEVELDAGRHSGAARDRADALVDGGGRRDRDPLGVDRGRWSATRCRPATSSWWSRPRRRRARVRAAARPVPATPADDDAGAANLGWAHRAAAHPVVGRVGPIARLEGAWTAALDGRPPPRGAVRRPRHRQDDARRRAGAAGPRHRRHGAVRPLGRRGPRPVPGHPRGRWAATPPPARAGCCSATSSPTPTTWPGSCPTSPPASAASGRRSPTTPTPSGCGCSTPSRHWLGAIARRRPVLLVLDDLQWAEHSSLRLLRHLVDNPPDGPHAARC